MKQPCTNKVIIFILQHRIVFFLLLYYYAYILTSACAHNAVACCEGCKGLWWNYLTAKKSLLSFTIQKILITFFYCVLLRACKHVYARARHCKKKNCGLEKFHQHHLLLAASFTLISLMVFLLQTFNFKALYLRFYGLFVFF